MKYITFFIAFFIQVSVFAQVFSGTHPETIDYSYRSINSQIPKRASLKAYSPFPKDQGANNNCVGWASAYAGRTIVQAMKLGWKDRNLITERAFSPGFTYYQASKGNDTLCQEGIAIKDAMQMLKYQGAVPYADFKSECPCDLNDSIVGQGLSYTIADYQRIFHQRDLGEHKIASVKNSLAQNQPVVLGMRCPPSFEKAMDEVLWKPTEAPEEPVFFGHALCIVGYDDVRFGGAFELQNSWGKEWGNEGYIWVKYDDFANFAKYAYTIISHEQAAILASADVNQATYPLSQEVAGLPSINTVKNEVKPNEKRIDLTLFNATDMNIQATKDKKEYTLNIPYTYGETLTLKAEVAHAKYLYVFGWNEKGELTPIYSHLRPMKAEERLRLAEEGIQIDTRVLAGKNPIASEKICVLLSDKPLEMDVIFSQLDKDPKKIKKQLYKLLQRHLVDEKDMTYKLDTMSVSSHSRNAIVPIFINAFHVP